MFKRLARILREYSGVSTDISLHFDNKHSWERFIKKHKSKLDMLYTDIFSKDTCYTTHAIVDGFEVTAFSSRFPNPNYNKKLAEEKHQAIPSDLNMETIEKVTKEGLKNTSMQFAIHPIDNTQFYIDYTYSPLTQVPYGPSIPYWIIENYSIYSVSAYVELGGEGIEHKQIITIHFKIKERGDEK